MSGRIERTQAAMFLGDETAGVGVDDATPVSTYYKERNNAFTGRILKATMNVKTIGAAVEAAEDAVRKEMKAKKALSE